jgi:hypothetical protein
MISEIKYPVKLLVIIVIIIIFIIKAINQLNGFLSVHNLKLDNDDNYSNSIITGFVRK